MARGVRRCSLCRLPVAGDGKTLRRAAAELGYSRHTPGTKGVKTGCGVESSHIPPRSPPRILPLKVPDSSGDCDHLGCVHSDIGQQFSGRGRVDQGENGGGCHAGGEEDVGSWRAVGSGLADGRGGSDEVEGGCGGHFGAADAWCNGRDANLAAEVRGSWAQHTEAIEGAVGDRVAEDDGGVLKDMEADNWVLPPQEARRKSWAGEAGASTQ